jgi:hypothetical protein
MSDKSTITIVELCLKTLIVHTITYTFTGILAFNFLSYDQAFSAPELSCWMRQTNDPLVLAGPLFQPIRGIIFALAFYPIREILFRRKNGWLITWWLLVALGVLSTFGPAPGSVEGMVYTILPISFANYLEVIPQAFFLAGLLFYWINNSNKKWLNLTMWIVFTIVIILPILGLITRGNV